MIKVVDTQINIINTRTRMPFRYGIAELSALPHTFLRVTLEIDGKPCVGVTAEGLAPKWFKKDKDQPFADELAEMFHVIEAACTFATDAKPTANVFDLWQEVYVQQMQWGAGEGYPPLLWGFGVSMLERAVIDAFCRGKQTTLARALRDNTLGIQLGEIHPPLDGATPADLLPIEPLRTIHARHTVGLGDPLTDQDIPEGERLTDGLPQSLAAAIDAYGLTHFKIKMQADPAKDIERLKQLADVLDAHCKGDYAFTLDFNEFFQEAAPFRDEWLQIEQEPTLKKLLSHLLFIEQPLHRDVAMSHEVAEVFEQWDQQPAVIIDEADDLLSSLPRALETGYAGTSFKGVKGIFKAVANACLLEHYRRADPDGQYIMSSEDFCILGPVALAHELTVAANLGIAHTERNGHHYYRGLSHLDAEAQQRAASQHGDVFAQHDDGFAALRIEGGKIDVGSLVDSPYGLAYLFDSTGYTALDDWTSDSLNPG